MAYILPRSAGRVDTHRGESLLDVALHARDVWGFSLVPVSSDKRATIPWKGLQDRRPSDSDLLAWRNAEGLAVITGPLSNVAVLDADKPDALKGRELPPTPTVKTRRGWHWYFRWPESGNIPSRANVLPKVDVRGLGGYAVLPTGGPFYTWALSPDEVDFAEVPNWLLDLLSPTRTALSEDQAGGQGERVTIVTCTPSPVPAPISLRAITGPEILAWVQSEAFQRAACTKLGLPFPTTPDTLGGKKTRDFRCLLPRHTEHKPSASLYRDSTGRLGYRDWHEASGRAWYSLADVFAGRAYGAMRDLSKPELTVWTLRLLTEVGMVRPVAVDLPPLSDTARPSTRKAYEAVRLLFGVRWLYAPQKPAPMAWRFFAAWSGLSQPHAGDALHALLKEGVIHRAGQHKAHGRTASLFLPGPGREVNL